MSRSAPRRRATRAKRAAKQPQVPAFVEDDDDHVEVAEAPAAPASPPRDEPAAPASPPREEPAPAAAPPPVQPTEPAIPLPSEPSEPPTPPEPPTPSEAVREEVHPGPNATELIVPVRADEETKPSKRAFLAWGLLLIGGLGCLIAALVPVGPDLLAGIGSTAVITAYVAALADRTGGRPMVFGAVALVLGIAVLLIDEPALRTGAAVMTCVVAAVLAVMVTVPAERFVMVARECAFAVLVSFAGALAVVGFDPVISLTRFEYVTLVLSLFGVLALVYRLGAGWHGLGRRGFLAVLIGGVILTVLVLYAELLRQYGPPGLVSNLLDGVRWSREHLGAFPRPIEAGLGIPALAWGVHMRARRRQGWWLCAFGAAGTAAVASSAINPAISLLESGLSVLYGLLVGLLIAFVAITVELRLTGGPRAAKDAQESATTGGSRGARRAHRPPEREDVRPEPPRSAPLL